MRHKRDQQCRHDDDEDEQVPDDFGDRRQHYRPPMSPGSVPTRRQRASTWRPPHPPRPPGFEITDAGAKLLETIQRPALKALSSNNQAHLMDKSSAEQSLSVVLAASSARLDFCDRNRPEEIMTSTQMIEPAIHRRPAGYNDSEPLFPCPITGYPCEGDLSHLCEDYDCARKGGLSPRSDENL
jgi:hypothetical protein